MAGILPLGDEVDQRLDVAGARLGGGADPLQAAHLEAVGPAEVAEGVVRRDEHALARGNAPRLLAT